MSSPSIQDFVEKIEAELRKPSADRSVELIAFWNEQIKELRSANTTSAGSITFDGNSFFTHIFHLIHSSHIRESIREEAVLYY
jgi:hypothetical protein